jgi:GMP synthase-like glutamine amidotransferase
MQVQVLQHVPFEDAANAGLWLSDHGHRISTTHWYLGERPDPAGRPDLLLVLGGPMNIYEHQAHPWLVEEKAYIARMLEAGTGALGICLGAQLLADILGGQVISNGPREIGWYPVTRSVEPPQGSAVKALAPELMAFHWHGDRIVAPPGSTDLYRSEACPAQAFSVGRKIVGLQFHLDYSARSIERMLKHCAGDLDASSWVQSPEQIRAGMKHLGQLEASLDLLLSALTENIQVD